MKVVFCEPEKFAKIIEVDDDLDSLYECLGCEIIQAVYPWEDNACIVCDDEGKLGDKDLCRALRDEDGYIYDVVAGSFIIAGLGEDNFDSLTDKQAEYYLKLFYWPELFILCDDGIEAIKVAEEPEDDE